MDTEDREHFKTIAEASAKPLSGSESKTSSSPPDLDYFRVKAKAICGCYRRDEAQDPETFAAALALVLSEFPRSIVDYAADPRTGIVTKYPMGLPNVGQIRDFCEGIQASRDRAERYRTLRPAPPVAPPPKKEGQFTYGEFLDWAEKTGRPARPIGFFER